ncbi:MAG: AAA family ATPase, partial [Candidatus Sulfotelmatobacter sp.]
IKPEAITWLWPERFPLGKMSLISGKPDNGKSQVTLDIIARTTTGSDWPDGSKNTLGPRDVLLAVAEDDLADTVIPRLKAAGADLNRIEFLNRVRTQEFDEKDGKKSEVRRLQLSEDVKKLRMAIEANPKIALVVVDTMTSYFGDVNANADQDIRPVMDALAKAFGDCGACFLGIIHHNKKSDVDALQAILGASSVAGAVRSAYSCSRDPENEDEFYFTLVKGNLTKKRTGMKYKMAEKTIDGITAPYIEWAGETNEDANSVMALVKESRNSKNQGVDKARLFIPMALENGPRPARELYSMAEAEGISNDQMRRAKDQLGVKVTKQKDGWYWSLPVKESSFLLEDVKEL